MQVMRKYFTWVMSLTIVTYLIIAIALVSLLTGCSEFETKIEEMNQLNCRPDVSECSGFLKG